MATKIIALDAGHGLKTPGKRTPDGIHEWELNDKVRDKVVARLKDYDVKFVFPDNNEGKTDESLTSRKSKYLNAKVDAVVSIHHNALTGKWGNATGVETWVDRNHTTADMKLAKCIQKRLPKYTGLKDRGIKEEDWTVIYQNKVAAVLTEGGFMDSRIDHPVITSKDGQDAYAKAIAEGLIEFLDLKKKKTVAAVTKKEESKYYDKYTGKSTSLDTILKEIGVPEKYRGGWAKRKPLAIAQGISNYTGEGFQNQKLISLARKGQLKKPV